MSTTMNRFLGSGSKAGGAGSSADTRKEWSKNSDLVRSQIAQKMLTEEEHLIVEREILEDYVSQSCFAFSTLKFFKAKMTALCKAYWKLHGREYQLSFDTTEDRQDAKRDKMEGIAFLDIVLRLFISTLLVRQICRVHTNRGLLQLPRLSARHGSHQLEHYVLPVLRGVYNSSTSSEGQTEKSQTRHRAYVSEALD